RSFSEYVTDEPDNEANQIIRHLLLKKIQQEPNPVYNKLLSWLYTQENAFQKAFVQEKALYQRSENKSLSGLIKLAQTAAEREAFEQAENILDYTVEKAQTQGQKMRAYFELMQVKIAHANPKDYDAIDKEFKSIFETYGKGLNTLKIQLQYADFLAFQERKTNEGKALLSNLLDERPSRFEEARIKMKMGDILVAEENFNQALIYYSQIKGLVKNSPLAQKARFKVAKTSYYKGDFDWAQTQLKVLKESTSELMANDAISLNFLIEENKSTDSTHTALKRIAIADLLAAQCKPEASLVLLCMLIEN